MIFIQVGKTLLLNIKQQVRLSGFLDIDWRPCQSRCDMLLKKQSLFNDNEYRAKDLIA